MKARLGTELFFRVGSQEKEKAKVRDYSMGGIAFFMERHLKLNVGDQVSDVELKIPREREPITFYNPLGVVIRIEHHPMEKDICVLELEFVGMSDATKEQLWRHIFEEQRIQLKKTKHI